MTVNAYAYNRRHCSQMITLVVPSEPDLNAAEVRRTKQELKAQFEQRKEELIAKINNQNLIATIDLSGMSYNPENGKIVFDVTPRFVSLNGKDELSKLICQAFEASDE